MSNQIVPIVLSGGSGTRLWPASRRRRPKQLLGLIDDRSMFLTTIERAGKLPDTTTPLVVSGADQQVGIERELGAAGFGDAPLILEPIGRNTAPAVAVAALHLTASGDDPLLLVLPADHVIENEAALAEAVVVAAGLAGDGHLVTFGITPTHAETGYGYIELGEDLAEGAMEVAMFREKPDPETAARYVADGRHLWNSGMFLFRAGQYLEELDHHQPEVLQAARDALAAGKEDGGVITLDEVSLGRARSISIDYAVMEPTDKAAVVPLDAGWNDVGSWEALWALGESDEAGNVITGDAETLDVTNSLIRAGDRLIAAIGLDNVAIVDTPDAILITARDRVQDVKEIVDRLSDQQRNEVDSDGTELRRWGRFTTLVDSPGVRVLRLMVEPGGRTSLRNHDDRSGYWIVVRGIARMAIGDTIRSFKEKDSVFVPAGTNHRLENASAEEMLEMIEIDIGPPDGEERKP